MAKIWAEIWTRPGDANFGRLIDYVPAPQMGLHDGLNVVGDGNMSLPDSFARIDEILHIDTTVPADCQASLVRYFSERDPATPFFEWLPNSVIPVGSKTDATSEVTGQGIKSILSHARVEPYDWDGSDNFASTQPDWEYGSAQNLLRNGNIDGTDPFPNGGFELGDTDYWGTTEAGGIFNPATISAVNSPADARSGQWYGLVNPAGAGSGARRSIGGLIVGESYTITGWMRDPTSTGDRWRAGITGASTATHLNAYEEDGYWWAEVGNAVQGGGASNGAWQPFTLTFVAGDPVTELVIVYQDTGDPNFQLDDWAMTGDGVGLSPWEGFNVNASGGSMLNIIRYTTAQSQSAPAAIEMQGRDCAYISPFGIIGYGTFGVRQEVQLTVGRTYTASVWVRHSGASNQLLRLVIQRQTPKGRLGITTSGSSLPVPGSYYMTSATVSVTPNTWTRITRTFTADVANVWFQVRYAGSAGNVDVGCFISPTIYIDSAGLVEGLPATTIGAILGDLYADATADHAGRVVWEDDSNPGSSYLTLDFDDNVDSAGQPWIDQELAIRIWMRMSYLQTMDQFARAWGYEWRIVPDNVEAGTWLWQVYNPGGMTTDYTGSASPAIQGGSNDTGRRLARFLPATHYMIEGLSRVTARRRDPDLDTALGRIESSRIDKELPAVSSVIAAAFEEATDALVGSLTVFYALVDPADEPLTAYVVGDVLNVIDPPDLPIIEARVIDIQAVVTPTQVEWEVELSPTTAAGS